MNVRPEARKRQLLGQRHAPYVVVPLEHEHLEPGPGEITRAGQPVVARADYYGIVPRRHRPTSEKPRLGQRISLYIR